MMFTAVEVPHYISVCTHKIFRLKYGVLRMMFAVVDAAHSILDEKVDTHRIFCPHTCIKSFAVHQLLILTCNSRTSIHVINSFELGHPGMYSKLLQVATFPIPPFNPNVVVPIAGPSFISDKSRNLWSQQSMEAVGNPAL